MREYFFAVKPKGKARPRVTLRGTYMPTDYTAYKEFVRVEALKQGLKLNEEELTITFYFQPPKSLKGKRLNEDERRNLIGKYCKQKPDIDNLIGAVMDALIPDDSSVSKLIASKIYADKEGFSIQV